MRVLVAMSGGVDSAVAALLCKKMGYTPVGVILRLTGEKPISSPTQAETDARCVADKLGIEFYVEDLRKDFKKYVTDKFIDDYLKGYTPNPCIDCNRHIKFGKMFDVAEKYSCDMIMTGHYAIIERDSENNFLLKKATDKTKDQSYMLYSLSQSVLSRVLLPLGGYTKSEIRSMAREAGFVSANSKDSQDICFVPDGDYASFIEHNINRVIPSGDFVTEQGEILGRHKGHIRYTPGQRKGLGLSLPSPLYVKEKDPLLNRVILCDGEKLMKNSIIINNVNLICPLKDDPHYIYTVKARYSQSEAPAKISVLKENKLKIDFISPVRAPAPGQAAVIYDGDTVIGGGTIE